MKKRLLSLALTLAMVLSFVPGMTVTANAVEHSDHCVCGDAECSAHGNEEEWKPWDSNTSLPTTGKYYLTDNVTLNSSYTYANDVVLCLNGFVVTRGELGDIELGAGDSLTLTDCNKTQKYKFQVGDNGLWVRNPNGNMEVTGGVITGTNPRCGVKLVGGTFTMYGGNIVGNGTGPLGGGIIATSSSTVTIYGGKICGNSTTLSGGGIAVQDNSTLNLYGGEISENTAGSKGGGIYCKDNTCTFNMHGAPVVSDNKLNGGGVNNVVMTNSAITIDDPLTGNAKIGVTAAADATIANGWGEQMPQNVTPNQYFISDVENFSFSVVDGVLKCVEGAYVPPAVGDTYNYSQLVNDLVNGEDIKLEPNDIIKNNLDEDVTIFVQDRNEAYPVDISEGESEPLYDQYVLDVQDEVDYYIELDEGEKWVVMIDYPDVFESESGLGEPRINLVKESDAKTMKPINVTPQKNTNDYTVTLPAIEDDCVYYYLILDCYMAGELEFFNMMSAKVGYMNSAISYMIQKTAVPEEEEVELNGTSLKLPSCSMAIITKYQKVGNEYLAVGGANVLADRIERSIQVNEAEHGTVTVKVNGETKTKAKELDTFTVTATPVEGYRLGSLVVTDAQENVLEPDEDGNYLMPRSTVDVTATFVELGNGHFHCVCGTDSCNSHDATTEWVGISSLSEINAAWADEDEDNDNYYYYLTADVTLNSAWQVPANVALCLNGHVVKSSSNEYVIIEVTSGEFILTDCKDTEHKFTVDSDGLWVLDETNGTKTVNGGVITGGYNGVFVGSSGDFTMYGGNIVGNGGYYDSYGTPACVEVGGVKARRGGAVTIYDGTICGNLGSSSGGIYGESNATLNVYGGTITENVATWAEGGVGGIGTFNSTLNVQGAPVIKGNKLKANDSSVESNVLIMTGGGVSELALDPTKINITGALHRDAEIGVTVGNSSFFTNGWSAHMVNRDPGEYFFADAANGNSNLIVFERSTDPDPDNLLAPTELCLIELDNNDILLDDEDNPMNGGGDVTSVNIGLSRDETFGKLTATQALPALEATPVPEEGSDVEIPDGFKMGLVSATAQTSKDIELDYTEANVVSEWVYVKAADISGIMSGADVFNVPADDYVVNNKNAHFIKTTIVAPVTFDEKAFTDMMALQSARLVYLYNSDGSGEMSFGLFPLRLSVEDNRITVIFADAETLSGLGNGGSGNKPSSRPSTGGGSSTGSTITVPVSNDKNEVKVEASVSGNDATIKPMDKEQIEQIVGDNKAAGDVVVDLTELGKEVDTAGIPKASLEAIVEAAEDAGNDTAHLVIKLTTAELKLDDAAMRAIVDQAKGDLVKFNFDDVGLTRMNSKQKAAVKDMDIRKGYEAYITVNGQRIGDFKGGKVEITVPYEIPAGENKAGFSVWYIDENGKPEKQKSTYDGKEKCFVVTHFSDYVIVYNEDDAQAGSYMICTKDAACPIHGYADASASAWYHDGVHYCIENGIMNGYSSTSFKPNGAVTRQQVWMTLARLSGEKPANSAEARAWAMANGVSDGTNPTKAVTRQQFITMLYRYAVDKGYDVSVGEDTNILSYADASAISDYAIPAMQWGCGSGIMGGYSDGTLKPTSGATRAHLAAFLQRFCEGA